MVFFNISNYLYNMKNKSIHISDESHKKIKDFCTKEGLKINQWCEKILLEKIENKLNAKKI